MCANWSRCSGRASAFAPASSRTLGPCRAGIGTAIAGRSTPGSRRRCRRPAASIAPVLPADTTASALAVGDRAHRRDEARVRLRAHRLGRLVGHLDHLGRLDERQPVRLEARRPVEDDVDPGGGGVERAEDHLAGRVVSTERVDRDAGHGASLRSLEAERLDFAALVRAAGRADAVRALRRPALRAHVDARRLDGVRGAALVATGLRGFPLRDGHEPRQCSRSPRTSPPGRDRSGLVPSPNDVP